METVSSNFSTAVVKNGGGETGAGRGTHCQLPSQIREFQVQGETLSPKIRCLWLPPAAGLRTQNSYTFIFPSAHVHKTSLGAVGKEGLCDTEDNNAKLVCGSVTV